jgi:DNA-binding GntR family transcriptional regulator
MTGEPLGRIGTVEAVAADLRRRVLGGELAPATRLRERELAERYGVARHSLRAALRQLAAERLVRLEPHRGAWVAALGPGELRGLYELRAALETEAARMLEERALLDPWPPVVAAAAARLEAACAADPADPRAVDEAHAALHHALVTAAGSARITEAHAALDAETRVFLLQLRPFLTPARMAAHHRELLAGLRRDGPDAVRRHVVAATEQLIAALPLG